MALLVRILEAVDYDPNSGRFKSSAFTPSSSDKAVSTFDLECAVAASGGPCSHIARFYPTKVPPGGGPVYFWQFDPAQLPAPASAAAGKPPPRIPRVVQSVSTEGDECHQGVVDFPESAARRFFKNGHYDAATKTFISVFRCSAAGIEQINTEADIPELQPPDLPRG
jgi:hypothetical protein